MTKIEFGRRLKAIRESKNLSQEEIANLIGLKDRSSISKIEKGQRGMDYANLEKLVSVLGINPLDLFKAEDPIIVTPHEKEILTAYRRASADTQTAVCNVLGVKKTGKDALSTRA